MSPKDTGTSATTPANGARTIWKPLCVRAAPACANWELAWACVDLNSDSARSSAAWLIVLLEELLLPLEVLARHLQRSAGGHHLGVAGGSSLIGGPGIDAHQYLPGLHAITNPGIELHHGAGDLGRDDGLAHGLDHTIEGRCNGAGRGLRRHRLEGLCASTCGHAPHEGGGQRGRDETEREHGVLSVAPDLSEGLEYIDWSLLFAHIAK